jgi:hypothetical protein
MPRWIERSAEVADEIEAAFTRQVQHMATIEKQLHEALQEIRTLEKQHSAKKARK